MSLQAERWRFLSHPPVVQAPVEHASALERLQCQGQCFGTSRFPRTHFPAVVPRNVCHTTQVESERIGGLDVELARLIAAGTEGLALQLSHSTDAAKQARLSTATAALRLRVLRVVPAPGARLNVPAALLEAPVPEQLKASVDQIAAVMEKGADWRVVQGKGAFNNAQGAGDEKLVFLRPGVRLGTLYWCDEEAGAPRQELAPSSLPLGRVTTVTLLGDNGLVLCNTGRWVQLTTKSRRTRDIWGMGIKAMLNAAGVRAVLHRT